LCGIGGKTIEEAQKNISYEEFIRWVVYRKKRGSLHFGMRIEKSSALLAQIIANRYRGKDDPPFSLYDFTPHEEEPELTIEDLKNWE